MRILLISSNVAESPYAVFPLGMSMVAAALERRGHEVTLLDFLAAGQSLDAVREAVRTARPELIGLSIRNIDNVNLLNTKGYLAAARDIVTALRAVTDVRIVVGGSGFSVMPEAVLATVGADYGVAGEGEQAFADFADEASQGRYPAARILYAPPRLKGAAIPPARYDPALLAHYLKRGGMAPVQTKRGCTHSCVYCTYPLLEGRAIREREPAAVVDDLESLASQHQARQIFFTDSVFNDDGGCYRALVQEMRRRAFHLPWTAFFAPSAELDDAIVADMHATGLRAAELGSDAATDTTLKGMGKGFTFCDVEACNDLFLRHDVATAHYFMFGGPGETPATVVEGIANIRRLKHTAVFVFMGIRILPDTPLARLAECEGLCQPGQSLLEAIYYISPGVDRDWMERQLNEGFAGQRHIVFPPDKLDGKLQFLYQLGFTGSLVEMLAGPKAPPAHGK